MKSFAMVCTNLACIIFLIGSTSCTHSNASAENKTTSWCTGLCKSYTTHRACVVGEDRNGKRKNEAEAECGAAAAGCFPSGCWSK